MDYTSLTISLVDCITILIVLGFVILYICFKISYTYWRRKGIPYLEPRFPLGNNDCIGVEAFSYGIETVTWYNQLKQRGLKYGGAWSWAKPVLLLTDPEYYKDVLVKDFNYFCDRDFYHNRKYDPKNENLFVLEKEEWRELRHKLSPVFTTAKMRMMFPAVIKCSDLMVEIFEGFAKSGEEIDIKEVCALFTTDVIGSVALGLDFQSFTSKEARFRKMGKEVFRSTPATKLKLVMTRLCSRIAEEIGIKNIPEAVTDCFSEVVGEHMEYRKSNNIKKPDFLQLLIDLYESDNNLQQTFTYEDLIGNVILFFIAGFETSSTTMHFALYELSKNQELQDKTREEIKNVLSMHNGELTYEAIMNMTFLRQVVDETLRKYPIVQVLARMCVKPYTFKNTEATVDPGITVLVPVLATSRDPDYFPEPEKFDPERFSEENKASINTFTYLPFGQGPRNCIGKRFGLMQTSIGILRILKDFKVSVSPRTKSPLTLKHGVFLMQTNENVYLKAEKL